MGQSRSVPRREPARRGRHGVAALTLLAATLVGSACQRHRGAVQTTPPAADSGEESLGGALPEYQAALDRNRALVRLEDECDKGSPRACLYFAHALIDDGRGAPEDIRRGVAVMQSSCDRADADACSILGDVYFLGLGVDRDPKRGVALYERGCEGGHAEACARSGAAHLTGALIEQDVTRGLLRLRDACEHEVAYACSYVGYAHIEGLGVQASRDAALSWYELACRGEHAHSCQYAGFMRLEGTESGEPDPGAASELFAKACDNGERDGCVAVVQGFEEGHGEQAAFGRARRTLEGACEEGDGEACLHVANLYNEGIGVETDRDRVMSLLRQGCDSGSANACYDLVNAESRSR